MTENTPSNLPLRVVTATSLFDGHDAAINVMRRLIQREGAEVIHLGHNRSVKEIVDAAIQEDAHAVAISSYQGGHMEFFRYMIDLLRENNAEHIRVYGGGGGVIVPSEIAELEAYGVAKIYAPEHGQQMGLVGMIQDMLNGIPERPTPDWEKELHRLSQGNTQALARCLTFVETQEAGLVNEEAGQYFQTRVEELAEAQAQKGLAPILGITGTGGAGKSSLTDEILRRFMEEYPNKRVAILSVDPTHRKTGGALLGDRIRMNSVGNSQAFMRSIATRQAHMALSRSVQQGTRLAQAAGYDLIIVETAGIGQSDTEIADLANYTLYVMTPEFGAASQLEKIGMLDYADMIAINKFDKRGGEDALRDVKKQVRRNRNLFEAKDEELPVHGTVASLFGDPATDAFYNALITGIKQKLALDWDHQIQVGETSQRGSSVTLPPKRERYLSEVSEAVRGYKAASKTQADQASRAYRLLEALHVLGVDPSAATSSENSTSTPQEPGTVLLLKEYNSALGQLSSEERKALEDFDALQQAYRAEEFSYTIRDKEIRVPNYDDTLAHLKVPKVVVPSFRDWGDRLRWLRLENVPGSYPFTGGVFPFKRAEEEPTRMFAGEGTPERTNRRFHLIASGQPAVRLSTAFDSVTLYGEDPDPRPDIYGKVGNSGVSICTLDDMKRLYSGFDLVAPNTSVSMTINGPAPIALAFFLNTAIDQQVERYLRGEGKWDAAQETIATYFKDRGGQQPVYREEIPPTHNSLGLGLLGIPGDQVIPPDVYANIKTDTLKKVRGTVQADILKEDQAQNTCIFSTDFALNLMGDIQAFFVQQDMANFYSVSVSGYHMAEAGANPISQVAFTLANGFTFVEYYLSRGLPIDKFARNLSFFFSNGMEAEYAVIGRVARRIWAVAMKEKYRAGERAQKLKYHIQTSGRSLHAQEISFNDIRTTLQALYAVYDNCNSLHTNAYDEAITTPTEESVRRAIAIQLVINRELGLAKTMNFLQGSHIIEELTDLVEEAILTEFDRLTQRGGVLGAMETMYQRGKIQDESLYYEELKHSGEYPIIGVNTFTSGHEEPELSADRLTRSSTEEKERQIAGLQQFHQTHAKEAPAAQEKLQTACRKGENAFQVLMETVKTSSMGQITKALYQTGGQYRRSM